MFHFATISICPNFVICEKTSGCSKHDFQHKERVVYSPLWKNFKSSNGFFIVKLFSRRPHPVYNNTYRFYVSSYILVLKELWTHISKADIIYLLEPEIVLFVLIDIFQQLYNLNLSRKKKHWFWFVSNAFNDSNWSYFVFKLAHLVWQLFKSYEYGTLQCFLSIILAWYLVNISFRRNSQSPLANAVMTVMMSDGLTQFKNISRNSWYNLAFAVVVLVDIHITLHSYFAWLFMLMTFATISICPMRIK